MLCCQPRFDWHTLMAHVVLVHGSFHDGRCWASVVRLLEAAGHKTTALNFTGQHGGRSKTPFRITAHDYCDDVLTAIRQHDSPAVVIAHSIGGFPASMAAEQQPGLIAKIIYVSALVPTSERCSAMQIGSDDTQSDFARSLTLAWRSGSALISAEKARQLFYQDCSKKVQRQALLRLQAQPVRPVLTKYAFTVEKLGSIGKGYIECARDQTLSLDYQRVMQQNQHIEHVHTLQSGHSPFLSQPEEFVRIAEGMIG